MAFIFLGVVLGLVFIVGLLIAALGRGDARGVGGLVSLVSLVLLAFLWGLASYVQIDAGRVGVVYQFGSIIGQLEEGPHFIAPWKSVREEDIRVQRHAFEDLNAFSMETQDVFVDATLNIRVSPQAIQQLYRTVGPDYFDILVAPRVAQAFKDETVKYLTVDIAPNRELIRHNVTEDLKAELSAQSIEVTDLLLENISFSPEFMGAIESKQIATQQALEQEQRVKVSEFQAQQRVAAAAGEGEAILVVAQKQAEANTALSASLTEELIRYTLIQKLGPDIKVIIMTPGQAMIFPPELLQQKEG